MTELAEATDQAACPVEYTPTGDSAGVKVIEQREGKYLTFTLADEEYGIGMAKMKGGVKILIDIDRVLSAEEKYTLEKTV